MTTLVLVQDAGLEALRKIDAYIGLLKTLITNAVDARQLLVSSLSLVATLDTDSTDADAGALEELELLLAGEPLAVDAFPIPGLQREGWIGSVSGPPPGSAARVGPGVSSRLDIQLCLRIQNALLAAEMSRHHPILDMLRVAASVNDGHVRLQETAHALIQLGLSQSTQANLAGYILKQMVASGSFVREGKGVYRMTSFPRGPVEGISVENAPDQGGKDVEAVSADAGEAIV